MKTAVFIVLLGIGLMVGGMMASYIFFGLLTLIGLIVLIESFRPLKWLVERTTVFIDILIFVCSIYATVHLGVTITASLTVAGVGFTLLYSPYVKNRRIARNHKNK